MPHSADRPRRRVSWWSWAVDASAALTSPVDRDADDRAIEALLADSAVGAHAVSFASKLSAAWDGSRTRAALNWFGGRS